MCCGPAPLSPFPFVSGRASPWGDRLCTWPPRRRFRSTDSCKARGRGKAQAAQMGKPSGREMRGVGPGLRAGEAEGGQVVAARTGGG